MSRIAATTGLSDQATRLPFLDDPRMVAPRRVLREERADGAFVLRSEDPLRSYDRCLGDWLERWAQATPDAPAFAEPAVDGGWTVLSWRDLRAQVGSIAQALLDLKLKPEAPIVVLSDNELSHLVLLLAGMHVGRPVCTVGSAYCRLAEGDFRRIHGILQTLDPALVYASDEAVYGPALRGAGLDAKVVFKRGAQQHPGSLAWAQLQATTETPEVMAAFAAIAPDSHAKYLLTSGSTGHPKVVINTHRMLCSNQQMIAQTLPFVEHVKPVLLDWLPWSHTFGGNHNIHLVLRNGGTMYIDDGRPVPGLIDRTIAHLREVQPSVYYNVPKGFDMLIPALEADLDLARHFFAELRMVLYAGAGMPMATWERFVALSARVRSEPLWFTTSWGSTETSPAVTFTHWKLERPGNIGLPVPGVDLKFVPNGDKLEMRVRGPNIFPGYRYNPEATAQAFDDEGYYCIGDAGYLVDPTDPNSGIAFNGRVAEDFKLTSGTWVSVGTLRLRVIAALAPICQDAVITGHDRGEIGILVFLTAEARRLPAQELADALRAGLRRLKAEGGGSSQTPTRALALADEPSLATGELTEKGYLNQRLTRQRRAADIEALYAETADPRVVKI